MGGNMPTIREKLEKLSKAELLEVFMPRWGFHVSDRAILLARYNVLSNRASRVVDAGIAAMEKWSARSGVNARIKWLEASAATDRGFRMYAKANKLLERGTDIDKD